MSEAEFQAFREGVRARIASATSGPQARGQARRPARGTDASRLALAGEKLLHHSAEAVDLYAGVAREHDLRDAWLGLACAHHLRSEAAEAAEIIHWALRRHAFVWDNLALIQLIAQAVGVPGWCGLDGGGELNVQLMRASRHAHKPVVLLDDRAVALRPLPSGLTYAARLPNGWDRAAAVTVRVDGTDLLGSPLEVGAIVRVEGFVDSTDGDLHGWAWCPNDPDRDPILTIEPEDGRDAITVVADDRSVGIRHERPLALPRGFRVAPDQLRRFGGPVRVRGAGRDLTGSPLDPSAERRGAERATRMLAGLFAAPGHQARGATPELPFLSVPAHVVGGPVDGGFRRRPVDVVVPVYGALERTLACLEFVVADLPRWARIVVVDDASPDPAVVRELAKFAARHRVILLRQPVNRGFPGTANAGIRHDAARDVALLNSDTLVPPGWLTSLREAAYSAADIGSATPLSNDASILSYPSVEYPNAMPDLRQTIYLDAMSQKANAGCLVDIPTAVAFCTYIKRDCLNATGLLREDMFAQGYGEENDFCIRARHLGWRHVAVPSMFVAHIGGHSFGARRLHLIERNLRKLNQLHPGYDALVNDFQARDPLAGPRRRLDLERWKALRSHANSVLLITHGRGGGVRRHVAERAGALRAEGLRPILLWPVASREGGGRDCVLGDGPEGGTPNLRFAVPAELDLLTEVLRADRPLRAEIHHMVGHDHRLMDLFRRLSIPYQVVVHDYSWLCPRVNLMGGDRRYCGEPEIASCEACVADAGATNDETTPPRALRERSAIELTAATDVIVPSDDVAARLRRHFPSLRPKLARWEDDDALPPASPAPLAEDGIRRVCVVGAIGVEKGYDMLLACARDAAKRNARLRFHLVGHSCDDARLLATGCVRITGKYEEHEVGGLLLQQQAQLAWLPSLWPETWCYTLTQAWQAGLNVLAFDIGAPAERIRRTGRGWIVPLGLAAERLNELMLSLRPAAADQEARLFTSSGTSGGKLAAPGKPRAHRVLA